MGTRDLLLAIIILLLIGAVPAWPYSRGWGYRPSGVLGLLLVVVLVLSRTSGGGLRTMREVADEVGVAVHVLRFWETRFPQLRSVQQSGGRRYYRPEDVELVRDIRHLLGDHGFTIKGVQRIVRERGMDRQRRTEG